jgi:hypothetical protein
MASKIVKNNEWLTPWAKEDFLNKLSVVRSVFNSLPGGDALKERIRAFLVKPEFEELLSAFELSQKEPPAISKPDLEWAIERGADLLSVELEELWEQARRKFQ